MLKIFPPTFVYSKVVPNHKEVKERYYPQILKDNEKNGLVYKKRSSWYCDVSSSFFANGDTNSKLFDKDFIDDVVWDNFKSFYKEMVKIVDDYPLPQQSNITQIWYNIYEKGDYQDMHSHLGPFNATCNFSGIYLLHLEEPNKTAFRQEGIIPGYDAFIYEYFTDNFEEGTVIIFPSCLLHLVKPCEKTRVTVSFNIGCQYF